MSDEVKVHKKLKTRVILTQDTSVQYESEMGQSIIVKLPHGTVLDIPSAWIYDHIPAICIADESHQTIRKLPDWFEDSSLETWFPLTAERIAQQDAERERVIEERRLALNKVAGLEATVETLKAALEGLLHRHNDGSEEAHWAEWDTAKEVIAQ